ncbi:LysR substrate-binding domain-containing protein [Sporosarcina sp. P19]|uniref:LysR substrate-binding domain-containing protein n=1 Tax=Sporosarcina sp. P19 TaxID=2048258 RepID=UPI001303FF5F|nr:LysR substrate-binding domain-containing protein [Sporosarcina sp. P19]
MTDRTKVNLTQTTALKGTLRIAASPVISQAILPDVLTRLHAKYPDMRLELTTAPSSKIMLLLKSNKADVGCSELDNLSSSKAFMQDELLLFASATHPLAHKRSSSILDLQNTHWILPDTEDPSRPLIDQALQQYGVQVNPTIIGSPESIKQAVLSGLGIAILSRHSCKHELATGELTVLDYNVTPIQRTFYTVAHSNTKEAQAFLSELEAYCRLWQVN